MSKVDSVYVFLVMGPDGKESLLPALSGEDPETLLQNRETAQRIATHTGHSIVLVRFDRGAELEILK